MKLLDYKTIKVGDIEFPIRITMRSIIDYESLAGSSITSMDTTEKLVKFFYCTAKAGAKATKEEFTYTYDEFLDVIDNYFEETITNISEALTESGGAGKKR